MVMPLVDEDAYTLSPEQIEQRVGMAKEMGATEVHIVGGFHPQLPLDYYENMLKLIKKKTSGIKNKSTYCCRNFFPSKTNKKLYKGNPF